MASVLHACTQEEQHGVVRFLWAKGLNSEKVHNEMPEVYGEKYLSRKVVYTHS